MTFIWFIILKFAFIFGFPENPKIQKSNIILGKGTKRGKSCNLHLYLHLHLHLHLHLYYDNKIQFKLRIHNSEGNKAVSNNNPFKWEVSMLNSNSK